MPPLAGVTCGWCRTAPRARWSSRMSVDDLRRRLGWRDPITGIGEFVRSESGRLQQLTILQEGESHRISVSRLRRAWAKSLSSTWITNVAVRNGEIRVDGRGFGHGVGLCQYGETNT